ncbi:MULTISPECIES: RNA pyrophosphohydrolase [unclassified Paracoccus (in: a-proteobacteria)]|uniref:RNA pyrophosphohydrolase n=1 Tax=unclassified Paracoccus (in: a-proteobacteria) TaxID=2688777 RepID=UPI0012B358AD|nr:MULTISPECIES: RNA pyrophosphohydrolase [unclassified Paracoccus (in: a-proteobacteria)]UXU76000.1 RNA pyrophosphohydrolase [Paracoccus sp. SMMA_5]UXU81910.1 RNA pyrophosphohydrolase [Paracoccus sp. SMMA_5_TC]
MSAPEPLGPSGLPYRPCAGVVLINPQGLIFAGQRIDNPGPAWQMPQGGIDQGETPRQAALRELVEETGVSPELVQVLAESPDWITYDLPPELLGKVWKGRYGGQKQKWFAMRFLGPDSAVRIQTAHPEFDRWRWMPAAELIDSIVPFKRQVYARVLADFAEFLA